MIRLLSSILNHYRDQARENNITIRSKPDLEEEDDVECIRSDSGVYISVYAHVLVAYTYTLDFEDVNSIFYSSPFSNMYNYKEGQQLNLNAHTCIQCTCTFTIINKQIFEFACLDEWHVGLSFCCVTLPCLTFHTTFWIDLSCTICTQFGISVF